jgi:putative ABC transport system ATP-binding protein
MALVLQCRNVEKYYGSKRSNVTKALSDVSFSIEDGGLVGIIGSSGSGKSTLLNCISTADKVTSGSIEIDGHDITKLKSRQLARFRRNELGLVFQDPNLIDTLTVFENIALALTIARVPAGETLLRSRRAAEMLKVSDVLGKFPAQLSGGQRQRVALARAIVNNPAIVLADEPTGSLETKSARVLLEHLGHINSDHGTTVLMATHDPHVASFCSRVLFLADGALVDELARGMMDRKGFFSRILEVVRFLGGDTADVL